MNNLSQNGKNKLVENIKNEIFHKIYVRTVFRCVMNGKNLGPCKETHCHYMDSHSNDLKS